MKRYSGYLISIIVIVFLYYTFLRDLNWAEVTQNFKHLSWSYLVLAVVLSILNFLIRGFKVYQISNYPGVVNWKEAWETIKSSNRGFIFVAILPARLGELVRAKLLSSSLNKTIPETIGCISVERILEMMLAFFYFDLIFLFPASNLPKWSHELLLVFSLLPAIIMVVFISQSEKIISMKWVQNIQNPLLNKIWAQIVLVITVFQSLSLKKTMYLMSFTATIIIFDSLTFWLMAESVHLNLSFSELIFVQFFIFAAILIPSAPGFVGTIQGKIILALSSLGREKTDIFVLSMLVQFFIFFPIVPLGLLPPKKLSTIEP